MSDPFVGLNEYARLNDDLREMEHKYAEALNREAELDIANAGLRDENAKHVVAEAALIAENAKLRENAAADGDEIMRLNIELADLREDADRRDVKQQDELAKLRGKVDFYERTMVPEEDLRVMTDARDKMSNELARLRDKNKSLIVALHQQDDEIARLREEVETQTFINETLSDDLDRLRDDLRHISKDFEAEKAEVARLRDVNAEKLAVIQQYQDENDREVQKATDLAVENARLHEKVQLVEGAARALDSENRRLREIERLAKDYLDTQAAGRNPVEARDRLRSALKETT